MSSPIFLDTIFTIVAGMIYGPLIGLGTGLLTHLLLFVITNGEAGYLYYAPISMITGLLIGLMARKGEFEDAMHLMAAAMLLALISTLMAAAATIVACGGFTATAVDHITAILYDSGLPLVPAVLLTSLVTNIIDKMISVFAAYGLVILLGRLKRKG